jgi:hypothetical protein
MIFVSFNSNMTDTSSEAGTVLFLSIPDHSRLLVEFMLLNLLLSV